MQAISNTFTPDTIEDIAHNAIQARMDSLCPLFYHVDKVLNTYQQKAHYKVVNTPYSLETFIHYGPNHPTYATIHVKILDISSPDKKWHEIYSPAIKHLPTLVELGAKTTQDESELLLRMAEDAMLRVALGFL